MGSKEIYKPSPKMLDVYRNAHLAKFRWLEGAVRSSKSFTANDIAIREIQQLPPCNVLISGYSITSVARNVLAEWKSMIGDKHFRSVRDEKSDYITINWRGLRGKKFFIRGAGKEHDYKQIQGATFGYWLADEITRHAQNFYNMAISRLSPPYAKAIGTTNPDSPFHYFKRDVLDRPELFVPSPTTGKSLHKRWTFYLTDNPSLSKEYIDSLKLSYTGVFYQRYILSQWVAAEGAIYDFFERKEPYVISNHPKAEHYVVGIDYGTGNPTVFGLFGVNHQTKPSIWLENEYVYDSKKHNRQKTDGEYSVDLAAFTAPYRDKITRIILDPSAASFKTQLKKDGFYGITDANNEVVDGIRTQARMLKSGIYAIYKICTKTIEDYFGYLWDEKAQLKGIDQPLKTGGADHTKDMERYVLYTLYGEGAVDYDKLTQW